MLMRRPWGVRQIRRMRRELAALGRWDVVVAHQLKTAYYGACLPAERHVLDLTDSLSLYRTMLLEERYIARWLTLTGVDREEARWASKYDVTVLSTLKDAAAVRELAPSANVQVVENGTRPWRAPVKSGRKDSVLYVGDLRYPPNSDGLKYLLGEIWPLLRVHVPDVRLRVIGKLKRHPSVEGVDWLGYVEELKPEYERALALLNTVRFGVGSRRKVLDAWAAGVPVVSTKRGAAGLSYTKGGHITIADGAGEFVSAINNLREQTFWSQASQTAWKHAQSYASDELWGAFWRENL